MTTDRQLWAFQRARKSHDTIMEEVEDLLNDALYGDVSRDDIEKTKKNILRVNDYIVTRFNEAFAERIAS